jgi:hypothetical protein
MFEKWKFRIIQFFKSLKNVCFVLFLLDSSNRCYYIIYTDLYTQDGTLQNTNIFNRPSVIGWEHFSFLIK